MSQNRYSYCEGNPVNFADPTGQWLDTALDVIGFVDSLANVISNPSVATIGMVAKAVDNKVTKNAIEGGCETKNLYHYTNEKGMNGIVESKQLNPSLKANNPKDARYGDGQYLSDITPGSKTPAQLSKEFINVPNKYKYTNYVEINTKGLNVIKNFLTALK